MILDTDIARSVAQQTEAELKRAPKVAPQPKEQNPNVERTSLAAMIKAGLRDAAANLRARQEYEARYNAEQEALEKRANKAVRLGGFDGEFPYEPSDPAGV